MTNFTDQERDALLCLAVVWRDFTGGDKQPDTRIPEVRALAETLVFLRGLHRVPGQPMSLELRGRNCLNEVTVRNELSGQILRSTVFRPDGSVIE
jgi:hypothetical protein